MNQLMSLIQLMDVLDRSCFVNAFESERFLSWQLDFIKSFSIPNADSKDIGCIEI